MPGEGCAGPSSRDVLAQLQQQPVLLSVPSHAGSGARKAPGGRDEGVAPGPATQECLLWRQGPQQLAVAGQGMQAWRRTDHAVQHVFQSPS